MVGGEHLDEVHVGAGREGPVHLQGGTEALQIDRRHVGDGHDGVGIAHAGGRHRQALAQHLQLAHRQPLLPHRQGGGHGLGGQERRAHVNADATVLSEGRHDATGEGLDLPAAGSLVAVTVRQETGQAADAVAAHLRLGAIGVEDPHPQLAALPGRQGEDHAIATHPEAAVAEPLHPVGSQAEQALRIL